MVYDVIIIGAGFAGVTAARELGSSGRRVLLLEARERAGGRTWSATYAERPFELGGAYVHWLQPHLWAELNRYGLRIVPGSDSDVSDVRVVSGGTLHQLDIETVYGLLTEAYGAVFAIEPQPVEAFPFPYDPLHHDGWRAYADVSLEEQAARADLTPMQRDLLFGMVEADTSAPLRDAALVESLRVRALIGVDDFARLGEVTGTYVIEGGTRRLLDAMLADSGAELLTGQVVNGIDQTGAHLRVTTTAGAVYEAAAVIVAVPLNTWTNIAFTPALSDAKTRIARERHGGAGTKCFICVAGVVDGLLAIGQSPDSFSLLTTYAVEGTTTWLLGFGAVAPDALTTAWAQAAVERVVPGVQVLDVVGHNWTTDPYALGTWAMLKPGQAAALDQLVAPEGRLVFATSDVALGWRGYIDGAIESGMRAARLVRTQSEQP